MLLLMMLLTAGVPCTQGIKGDDAWMYKLSCKTHCAYNEMGNVCAKYAVRKLQCDCPGLSTVGRRKK